MLLALLEVLLALLEVLLALLKVLLAYDGGASPSEEGLLASMTVRSVTVRLLR